MGRLILSRFLLKRIICFTNRRIIPRRRLCKSQFCRRIFRNLFLFWNTSCRFFNFRCSSQRTDSWMLRRLSAIYFLSSLLFFLKFVQLFLDLKTFLFCPDWVFYCFLNFWFEIWYKIKCRTKHDKNNFCMHRSSLGSTSIQCRYE